MTVPVVPRKVWNDELAALDDDEMLPPHEIVARGSAILPKTTFLVLEGVGRRLWFTLSHTRTTGWGLKNISGIGDGALTSGPAPPRPIIIPKVEGKSS
ncbi:hypothetical protein Acr_06g0008130 [Actinidia rufa]|uniref:Uncharacterized protein n=1 Tax=Actinidia rufa TaxID=165716 RepID=A0A7J0ER12_9ERIC|nr:hypothetical protein Acr_06g0008130 [Actinidia rufa]